MGGNQSPGGKLSQRMSESMRLIKSGRHEISLKKIERFDQRMQLRDHMTGAEFKHVYPRLLSAFYCSFPTQLPSR